MKEIPTAIRNPMTIIVALIGVIEVGMGVGLGNVDKSVQSLMVLLMTAFATLTAASFFVVLLLKPQNLYGPGDFRDENNYLTLNARVSETERLISLVQREIEAMPLFQYTRLSEPTIRLFLRAYHHELSGREADNPNEIWARLLKEGFSESELSDGLKELERLKWLSTSVTPFERTETGKTAHASVRQFVYGRLA